MLTYLLRNYSPETLDQIQECQSPGSYADYFGTVHKFQKKKNKTWDSIQRNSANPEFEDISKCSQHFFTEVQLYV